MMEEDNGQGQSDGFVQEDPEVYGEQLTAVEDERKRQFIIVDYPVVENMAAIGKNAFLVYCALARFADQNHCCWPTWGKLREVTGLGRHAVRLAIGTLKDWGFIETQQLRKGREFGSNVYLLKDLSAWVHPSKILDVQKLDVQKRDVPQMDDKLDPVLTRSRSELDPEKEKKETPPSYSDGFSRFWEAYPVKKEKQKAWKVWKRDKLEKQADTILASIRDHQEHDNCWKKGFIKHPPTFLGNGCWLDELVTGAPTACQGSKLADEHDWDVSSRTWLCRRCGVDYEKVVVPKWRMR